MNHRHYHLLLAVVLLAILWHHSGALQNVPGRRLDDQMQLRRPEAKSVQLQTGEPGNDYSPKNEYTVVYPAVLPQRRGGKALNLTLPKSGVPFTADIQSRIVNKPFKQMGKTIDPPLRGKLPRDQKNTPAAENELCVCIPYYLCKDGFVTSGGLRVSTLNRRTRSPQQNLRVKISPRTSRSDAIAQYLISQYSSECGPRKMCCNLASANEYPSQNEDKYPVATPIPDRQVPDQGYPDEFCGLRLAYGVQGRLLNVAYPADASEYGEFPWQIAILKKTDRDQNLYLCGGVLISPQWIATAAHCLKQLQSSQLLIRLGEWDVDRRDEIYPFIESNAISVAIHPKFNSRTLQNDIALVRLREAINPQYPHITPACLPQKFQSFLGQKCWVSGWGKDSFGPRGTYQHVLKKVDVPILANGICEMKLRDTQLGPYFRLHPGFLCAGGEPAKDACTGDGGSALVCENSGFWYVVGLVSWGIGCGQQDVPGVYTNIPYYTEWINNIIRK